MAAVSFQDEMKVLGVPAYQPKATQANGSLIARITKDLLQQWKWQDSIVVMTFDTAASNSEHNGRHYCCLCFCVKSYRQSTFLDGLQTPCW